MAPIKIGIGGPVGSGKTELIERITRALDGEIEMAAITNDIYTLEDAKILARNSVLDEDRIIGVETGGCPHTAIREDTSMNDAAYEEIVKRHPNLGIVFVEADGDNLSFAASVGSPDITSDEYVPLKVKISRMGAVSMGKDSQLDTASDDTQEEEEEGV